MKIADTSTKIITNNGTIFEPPSEFPEVPVYVKHSLAINKIQLQRKVFFSCKIESSLRLLQFKFEERTIMAVLIKHNTFTNYNKHKTLKEDSIGWFKYISSMVPLQKITRLRLEEASISIYDREGNKNTN